MLSSATFTLDYKQFIKKDEFKWANFFNMAKMKTDIEIKLKNALIEKILQIKEARIDGILEKDFQILKVEFVQPVIDSPSDISKGDYKNAKEIKFVKGKIRVSELNNNGLMENIYYFDGTATVNYVSNNFLVNVSYITIYTN